MAADKCDRSHVAPAPAAVGGLECPDRRLVRIVDRDDDGPVRLDDRLAAWTRLTAGGPPLLPLPPSRRLTDHPIAQPPLRLPSSRPQKRIDARMIASSSGRPTSRGLPASSRSCFRVPSTSPLTSFSE